MSELAVLRYDINDDDIGGGDIKHYLSVISARDLSVIAEVDLPFPRNQNHDVAGSSCRGLLIFHDFDGHCVVCNLTTKQFKLLPLPELDSNSNSVVFKGFGFGYDSISDDYKVIRNYSEHFSSEDEGIYYDLDGEEHTQAYSLKTDSWKEIESPESFIISHSSVYIENKNSIYWTSLNDAEPRTDGIVDVVSFDLSSERFSNSPLPPTTVIDPVYDLVEHRGALGAIVYDREENLASSMEIWESNETRWNRSYSVSLCNVDRPVGLWKDQFVFLDAKSSTFDDDCGQLLVYDLLRKETKKLSIYSCPNYMKVISYAKNEREDLMRDATKMSETVMGYNFGGEEEYRR